MTVYFARNKLTGNVKIGFTAGNPLARLKSMQTGCDGDLVLLGMIEGADESVESSLHRHFRALRVRGEWFREDGSISALLQAVAEKQLAPTRRTLVDCSIHALAQRLTSPTTTGPRPWWEHCPDCGGRLYAEACANACELSPVEA